MSKLIFKPMNIFDIHDKLEIKLPEKYKKFHKESEEDNLENEESKEEKVTKYQGPSLEQLQEEVKSIKENAENEANIIILRAKESAENIVEESKKKSFEIYQEARTKIKNQEDLLEVKSKKIDEVYKFETEKAKSEAEINAKKIEAEAYEKSYNSGREDGYNEGKKEIDRLIYKLDQIVSRAVDIKKEIIESSEKQIINMILTAIRKIVKDEISSRKQVVLNNIKETLKYLKDKEQIDIRVNLNDLELVSSQKEYFLNKIESLKYINIYEDSRVEPGGVIIDTQFGTIDARISTQLREIENAIKDTQTI